MAPRRPPRLSSCSPAATPPDSPDVSSGSGSDSPGGKRRARAAAAPVPKRRRGDSSSPGPPPSPPGNFLFQALLSGKAAMEPVVDEWLLSYQQDQELGLLLLINCILRVCGCRASVTPEMFRTLQNSEIIQQLTEKFKEESPCYPLSQPGRPSSRLRGGFSELLGALVRRGRAGLLGEGSGLGCLLPLLTGLAHSPVRAFRHTATFAALKVMTSLVGVALGVAEQRVSSGRQLEAERGKDPRARGVARLEGLLRRQRELQEQQEEMEALMNTIFKGIFVHRYRDVVPEIRALCVEELGGWMRSYPSSFLTDSHLKYIGWTLHDKQRDVRLCCVRVLGGLYARGDTAPHMELFTSRFKARLLSMVLDKEPEVAVETVKLLTVMLEHAGEALSQAECQPVFAAVFAASRALGAAAGTFLCRRLLCPPGEPGGCDNRLFLRRLLRFFLESEVHEHAAYLVDSLWDCAGSRLRDWETLGALLLEEAPDEALSDAEEQALVEILAASAHQATQGPPPGGHGPPRKPPPRQAREQERTRLTHGMVPVLPQLLAKFSAEAEKVTPLLELVQCCDLGVFRAGRLEKAWERVLRLVPALLEQHAAPALLGAGARALHALCDPRAALRGRADLARGRLVDGLAEALRRRAAALREDAPPGEEELYSTAATLRRLAALFSAHDLTPWRLWEPCARLLRRGLDLGDVGPEVIVPCVTCLHFHILWQLARLPSDDVPQEQLGDLRRDVSSFVTWCQSCLEERDGGVREQAFVVLSDLLVVLGPALARVGGGALTSLVTSPDAALQAQLAAFLMDHVFQDEASGDDVTAETGDDVTGPADDVTGLERLQRRRRLLGGFCRLLLARALPPGAASDVTKHYAKFYADYGDIIKETLSRIRRRDPQEWGGVLLLSLTQLLTELLLQGGPDLGGAGGLGGLRDLGRRLSLLFGPPPLRDRPVLLRLHREGIVFAFQDPPGAGGAPQPLHLPFLEALSEFCPPLPPPDRLQLLSYLDKTCQERRGGVGGVPAWPPLLTYRNALRPPSGGGAGSSRSPATPPAPPPRPLPSSRPRRDAPPLSSPWPSSRFPSPALTSTVLRGGPRPPPQSSSQSYQRSGTSLLSLMEEEEEEEEAAMLEEESTSEGAPEQDKTPPTPQNRLRDLFDSILSIEDA